MLRRWAPLAAAVSVLAVAVTVSAVVGQRPASGPPVLRLASTGGTGAADAGGASTRAVSGSAFRLVGPLPAGPADARTHPLPAGAAAEPDVRRLAQVLAVSERPRRVDRAWQAGTLRVEDTAGQPWSLGGGCGGPDTVVSSDGASTGCASPGSPQPTSPQPRVDLGSARRAAGVVLAALGLHDSELSVEPAGQLAFVAADPRVAGLPTSGFRTRIELDASGAVLGGNGYLARPTDGASYPLVTAKAAFDALPELPRPRMACPIATPCPEPPPAQVTGAQLGLALTALTDGRATLLPAWLFSVQNWPTPLATPAVEPRFLTLPTTAPSATAPPSDQPSPSNRPTSRAMLSFDSAFPGDDPKTVIVQYGDSSGCPHQAVTHAVKESAESVVVLLEADAQPAERACTLDYRQMLVTVRLLSPLGSRTVVDGSRGTPVPVDRSCARPMGDPPVPRGTVCRD